MFDHERFDVYSYRDIPLDRDCYLIAEDYMQEYEHAFLNFFSGGPDPNVGYVAAATVRTINDNSIDLSWYPNVSTRFHEVAVSLPKDQFVACVGSWQCDEKPHLFVRTQWLEELYLRSYSVFCLVDADYFTNLLRAGRVTQDKLVLLRTAIDGLAADHPDVLFISVADSLILKSNWTAGHFQSDLKYTYRPETFLRIFSSVRKIYMDSMGLKVHGVITQGSNEYYRDPLSHTSELGNHICLNSLGVPFAQLWSIDDAVKKKRHPFSELYIDEQFYRSLRFRFDFAGRRPEKHLYACRMMGTDLGYYCAECQELLDGLQPGY